MNDPKRIGVSADFQTRLPGLIETALAEHFPRGGPFVWEYLPAVTGEAPPEFARDFDAILTFQLRFTSASFPTVGTRLCTLARWGVGYDYIDVPACTRAGVALTITPEAVRRPMAEGALSLLLAVSRRLVVKDRQARAGQWDRKGEFLGTGCTGRTLGLVGVGNIGADFLRLAGPLDFGRRLAYDPFLAKERAAELGLELVSLEQVCREADFISVHCPLTAATRHLLGEAQFALMKPSAFIINTARGPIIDQAALVRALRSGQIAGAGLDVFETEPLVPTDPLTALDNVVLAPHSVGWTDELAAKNSRGACHNVREVLAGRRPAGLVNPDVWESAPFQSKLGARSMSYLSP
jgi:phosphoglycerate dehydrogenase-like enzyme